MGTIVGIKLEISPDISPRDTSLGTKIFTLLPQSARTVKEVRKHVAENILKTPMPFHFYTGEFRIPDEEDVLIFSCLPEPCRVVPAVPSKSSLSCCSTTPSNEYCIEEGTSVSQPQLKRVKFSDFIVTSSPIPDRPRVQTLLDFDQIDNKADKDVKLMQVSINSQLGSVASAEDDADSVDLSAIGDTSQKNETPVQKKRRRRRQSKKQKKSLSPISLEFNSSASALQTQLGSSEISVSSERKISDMYSIHTAKRSFQESEDAEVKKPFGGNGYSASQAASEPEGECENKRGIFFLKPKSSKRLKNGGSIPFGSPSSSSSRIKSRVDTPALPRVLKNPGVLVFEVVKQNMTERFELCEFENSINENTDNVNKTETVVLREDEFYQQLDDVKHVDEICIGDILAFKLLEMNEAYCPQVSSYKEARVTKKTGTLLNFEYIKNDAIIRSGIFEVDDADLNEENSSAENSKYFCDLLQPKLIRDMKI